MRRSHEYYELIVNFNDEANGGGSSMSAMTTCYRHGQEKRKFPQNKSHINFSSYCAHAICIPVFTADASWNDEQVVRVVNSLDALQAVVVRAIKRDLEIWFENIRLV
jgi:hypothetical protein